MPRTPDMHHILDGVKSVPISQLQSWSDLFSSEVDTITSQRAVEAVPFIARCVHLRAAALSAMPYSLYRGNSDRDSKDTPAARPIVSQLREFLWRTELALCVHGQAYWLPQGKGTWRWLAPTSITPRWDVYNGLIGFERTIGGGGMVSYQPIN
ncbi:MAG: hypothetical protein HC911_18195 [Chloroflexaceae bacterium]|nr:hypothetical protein [Chloroflexaceae bacterium]